MTNVNAIGKGKLIWRFYKCQVQTTWQPYTNAHTHESIYKSIYNGNVLNRSVQVMYIHVY